MEERLINFIEEFEKKIVVLSANAGRKYFEATVSGKQEDYAKASEYELELNKILADKEAFKEIKAIKENGEEINDPFLKRQLEIIFNDYAGSQFNPELMEKIVKLSNKVEEKFSTYRAVINDKIYTDNEIDEVLDKSKNSDELKDAWEASKQIGGIVKDEVLELVKMRNKAAAELGYKNYHQMSLSLSEQNPEDIEKLFDELNELTGSAFDELKNQIDEYLAAHYNISKDELMPWHYQDKFFQQGPKIYNVDLDKFFEWKNIVDLTKDYYNGIGLDINDMLDKSDLFEKPNKYQHAYCTNIDRSGDIRVVCNVKQNQRWMGTMLHEFGHAVYDKYVSPTLPWTLRTHAHIFTTEAIAMLFGRFASNPDWLKDMVGISEKEKNSVASDCLNNLRLEQLVFSRWVQVMYRFEKGMYENPDQDLNTLWWNLVEKYQMIKKPADRNYPDWAAKIHVALYPAYYHNYMLGELLASQLYHFITEKVLDEDSPNRLSFKDNKSVGEYLIHLFFSYGALLHWKDLIVKATGEELTPKYYADQFIGEL